MNGTEQLTQILRESKNVVFFGGAGMSTESGVPDFRSANGIYSRKLHQEFRPEEMASHSFFVNHTEAFYEFYREHRIFRNVQPNAGHKALAELEQEFGVKVYPIVTIREVVSYLHNREIGGRVYIDDVLYARVLEYQKIYGVNSGD